MPVIALDLNRLSSMVGKPAETILDTLPYLGLDIESGVENGMLRVEYSPNRPDYGSEVGILRGLKGLLGIETGTPRYSVTDGSTAINVKEGVAEIRPHIVGLVAGGVRLDDESIKQLITLQEDLHNGVGRRRRAASIGIHDFGKLRPPILYTVADASFEFIPLGETKPMAVERILKETEQGIRYGYIVSDHGKYPLLVDSVGSVLSMPPIINGVVTTVTQSTDALFIDITATSLGSANTCLNILACQLADMGAQIESVQITDRLASVKTPKLDAAQASVNIKYVQRLLGLKLTPEEIVASLAKSRLTSAVQDGRVQVEVPAYRSDIIHPVDIVEEVALGYHIARFKPTLPRFKRAGGRISRVKSLHSLRTVMIGLGYCEIITPTLVDSTLVSSQALRVEEPKSSEYEYLRDRLTPSLLRALSRNKHEPYPQRIFEVGRVFRPDRRSDLGVREENQLVAAVAYAGASFTEIRSALEGFLKSGLGIELSLRPGKTHPFTRGRCALVMHGKRKIGYVGEITPGVLNQLGLEVPVALFEVNLDPFLPRPSP